ncbi:MAG: hypothetical protein ABI467_14180 [Kofleriaceae bacterium]
MAATGTCSVNIVRAPDAVRETIEHWLANERCTLALEVRIIPTEGGLYVLATDEHGRVRERIVPDPQSAGVLIASWAADDGLGGATPPLSIAELAPQAAAPTGAPIYGPPPQSGAPPAAYGDAYAGPPASFNAMPFRAPGQYGPGQFGPTDELPGPAEVQHPTKLVSFAAGFGANSSGGLRLELELWNHRNWIIGASASITGSQMIAIDGSGPATFYRANMTDLMLAVTLGRIARWGDWYVRGNVGAGVMVSSLSLQGFDNQTGMERTGSGSEATPYVEAGLYLGHSIGSTKQWELEAGPVLAYSKQDWYVLDAMTPMYRDAGNAMVMLGLRRGL